MDFIGTSKVILRPRTVDYPVDFVFAACTTATANDGSIPYGATIASAALQILTLTGDDITNEVGGSVTVADGLRVSAALSYPTSAVNGGCKVIVLLTLSTGAVLPKRWDGLEVRP